MGNIKISASMMCANWCNLKDDIKRLEDAKIDMLHFDIMDGVFVPNLTIGLPVIQSLRKITSLPFDVHLMIVQPERYFKEFKDAGADIITFHVEATDHSHRALLELSELRVKRGIALSPSTPIGYLENLWDIVDIILVMCVNPGFAGQKFIPEMVDKVRRIKEEIDKRNLDIDIMVDGNINIETIPKLYKVGTSIFVGGTSGLFLEGKDFKQTVSELKGCTSAVS